MISPFLTRPVPKLRVPPAEDPQRQRFYRMEREFVGASINHVANRTHLQAIADHACAYYKIKPVKVIVYRDLKSRDFGESVYYSTDNFKTLYGHAVRLNRGFHGANAPTLLHELAHYIVDDTYVGHRSHGKQFVGVYMHLLAKYRVIPSDSFRVLAKRYRVKIAGKFKPGAIRG
ncbi:MAG: hypothetical protein V3V10_11235 [Planctomycetota bacterium]